MLRRFLLLATMLSAMVGLNAYGQSLKTVTLMRSPSVGPNSLIGFQGAANFLVSGLLPTRAEITNAAVTEGFEPKLKKGAKESNAAHLDFHASVDPASKSDLLPNPEDRYKVSVWTTDPMNARSYDAELRLSDSSGHKQDVQLRIAVFAEHVLKADEEATHFYVVGNASNTIHILLKSALGLQDIPGGTVRLKFENQSELASDATITNVALYDSENVPVAYPTLHSTFNRPSESEPSTTKTIPGHGSSLLFVDLSDKPIQPGTYSGYVEVESTFPDTVSRIPFKLDVRDYPLNVTLLMILFTFLGYLVFWLQGPKQAYAQQLDSIDKSLAELCNMGRVNNDAYERLKCDSETLWKRVDPSRFSTANSEAKRGQAIRMFLGDVWPWSVSKKPDPTLDTSLSTDIASLRAIIGAAMRLSDLDAQIQTAHLSTDQKVTLDMQVMKVWKAIVQIDAMTATTGISQIVGELFDPSSIVLPTPKMIPGESPAMAAVAPVAPAPAPIPSSKNPTIIRGYLGGMSIRMGPQVRSNIQTIQNVRRLTTSVGIFLLFAIGINLLYVNVPGFGHSIYDYIKVIGWSFSTGAAGRGLSTTIGSWAQNLLV